MSRILTNPTFGNQVLEIADPIKDLNEDEITVADYKFTHVDIGPQTLEGDIYHADFSVNALIQRVNEERKERV